MAGVGPRLGRLLPVVGGHEGLHSGQDILRELRARFDTIELGYGPYFFPDLAGTSEADEQAAIDAGQIQANRIQYRGRRREATAQPDLPAVTFRGLRERRLDLYLGSARPNRLAPQKFLPGTTGAGNPAGAAARDTAEAARAAGAHAVNVAGC
jgi:hypothetical protein